MYVPIPFELGKLLKNYLELFVHPHLSSVLKAKRTFPYIIDLGLNLRTCMVVLHRQL